MRMIRFILWISLSTHQIGSPDIPPRNGLREFRQFVAAWETFTS
ncbi:hypothetical protein 16Q_084c [Pseudomonas phage 16Q]|nr:hypothetical protein 16Q_084c [Pseudomonas phage 16Q]